MLNHQLLTQMTIKEKSQMNKKLLLEMGFVKQLQRIAHGFCPTCGLPTSNDFKDELSRREYEISGLCQDCQDDVFGKDEE